MYLLPVISDWRVSLGQETGAENYNSASIARGTRRGHVAVEIALAVSLPETRASEVDVVADETNEYLIENDTIHL